MKNALGSSKIIHRQAQRGRHMKIKKALLYMLSMRAEAWYIFIRCIQLCCVLLVCSFALLVEWDGSMLNYELYMTAMALNETSQALFLIGVIASAALSGV